MSRKSVVLAAAVLIIVFFFSLILAFEPSKQISARPFYVGVEFAFGSQFSQVKAMVDEVKGYTNLFVLGSVTLTFNRTALDESCDYLYNSGLNFIVLITQIPMYNVSNGYPGDSTIFDWMGNATKHYGKQLLGFYRYDEPGGNQVDNGNFQLVTNDTLSYSQVTSEYVDNLGGIIQYYATYGNRTGVRPAKMFTSDYALYWFDYQSEYSAVFGEFVGNESRQAVIALDRGAANSFNRPWGVIVTWNSEFNNPESKAQLLSDLSTAYSAGATYAVVFPFNIPGYSYWTLPEEDFNALQTFWSSLRTNPGQIGATPAKAAYVVPPDFGFGFRSASDSIWGLFSGSSDSDTAKIWNDTQVLLNMYPDTLNIIYDNQTIIKPTLRQYSELFYYNQTVT